MNALSLLREASEEEVEHFIFKAEKHLPHSLTVFGLLSVGFRRKYVDRSFTKIWVPEKKNTPCFILITGVVRKTNCNSITAFWNPDEIRRDEAKALLKTLPNWDWKIPLIVYTTASNTLNEIETIVLGDGGLGENKLVTASKSEGYAFKLLDEENIKHIDISEREVFFGPVKENFLSTLHSEWIYKFSDSLEGIRSYWRTLPSVAAYVRSYPRGCEPASPEADSGPQFSSSDGSSGEDAAEPVSWALCRHYGEIGFTHTRPEYRNKGLAAATTLALAGKLVELGISPFVTICGENLAAVKAHEKIGFRKHCPVGYLILITEDMSLHDL